MSVHVSGLAFGVFSSQILEYRYFTDFFSVPIVFRQALFIAPRKRIKAVHENKARHVCFSLTKMAREFASRHHESIASMSLDNKVPIGSPIVHRQCQINKLFLAGDFPNLPDHDIRGSGSIYPNG